MREYKFRCQHCDGKWYYFKVGELLLQAASKDETLGQFTGLKDKNGKEIYEGDFILAEYEGSTHEGNNKILKVEWNNYFCAYRVSLENRGDWDYLYEWNEVSKIIGNIYENP